MENSSKLSTFMNTVEEWITSFSDWIQAQPWVSELKTKWDSLEPQHKRITQLVSLAGSLFFIFFLFLNSLWSVSRLKTEVRQKKALLTVVQLANEEMQNLQNSIPNALMTQSSPPSEGPWNVYFENLAASVGIAKENITLSSPNPGSTSEQSKEFLMSITIRQINLKQVASYALALENGKRPVKVRNLMIDTKNDLSGYLETILEVSAFTLVESK